MAFDFILAMKSNQKRRIFGLVFKSQFLKMFVTTIIVNARLFAGSFTHCVKLNTLVLNSSNTPQVFWWCALEINTAVSTIHFAQLHSLTLRQKVPACRMEAALPSTISLDQTSFIKNRYSFFNIRCCFNILYSPLHRVCPR